MMRTKRPFFIVGTPRSGTTLLQAMLMVAPGAYVPPETHFMARASRLAGGVGAVPSDQALDGIIEDFHGQCRRHEIPVDPAELEQAMRASGRTCAELFDALLFHLQTRQGCERIGEKSPAHLAFVPALLEAFPDSQAITLIRDARDVALSQGKALGRSTIQAAVGWKRDQRLHARYAASLEPHRYASVRYEDLVTRPQDELRRLCEFLDLSYSDEMTAYHERQDTGFAAWEEHKLMTLEPLTADRIGRYRTHMSASRIAAVQAVAGAELTANGYGLERVPSLPGYLLAARELPGLAWTHLRMRAVGR